MDRSPTTNQSNTRLIKCTISEATQPSCRVRMLKITDRELTITDMSLTSSGLHRLKSAYWAFSYLDTSTHHILPSTSCYVEQGYRTWGSSTTNGWQHAYLELGAACLGLAMLGMARAAKCL